MAKRNRNAYGVIGEEGKYYCALFENYKLKGEIYLILRIMVYLDKLLHKILQEEKNYLTS